jgi:UV excision repair protein Rad23
MIDEAVVGALCEMGFPRDQVLTVLTAAFGNADRAVQYLFDPSAMPATQTAAPQPVAAPAPPPAAAPPAPTAAPAVQPAPGGATTAEGGPFTADSILAAMGGAGAAPPLTPVQRMANEPQLLQLITLARQNPSSLGSLLQELSTSAPHLLHMVQADQQTFQQLLTMDTLPIPAPSAAGAAAPPPPAPSAASSGGAVQIQLTRAEAEAIGRLQQLGFTRDQAAQAFLACEKNETLAANLLFDGGF